MICRVHEIPEAVFEGCIGVCAVMTKHSFTSLGCLAMLIFAFSAVCSPIVSNIITDALKIDENLPLCEYQRVFGSFL